MLTYTSREVLIKKPVTVSIELVLPVIRGFKKLRFLMTDETGSQ